MINKCYIEKSSHFLSDFIELYNLFLKSYMDISEPERSAGTEIGTMGFRISGLIDGYVTAMVDKIANFQDNSSGYKKCVQPFLELFRREADLGNSMAGFSLEPVDIGSSDPTLYIIRKLQPSVTMKVNTNGCVFELYAFMEMNLETNRP